MARGVMVIGGIFPDPDPEKDGKLQPSSPDPAGLKRFAGYGATEADLRRGFLDPGEGFDPQYDLSSHKNDQPRGGFLPRSRIPTER